MKSLVTGGSGYLGRLLILELVNRGYECISVDLRDGTPEDSHVKFVRADACDLSALEKIIENEKIDLIFHLATQIDFAVENQRSLYHNNVESTRAVAKLASKYHIPKVLFISSSSMYLGNFPGRPITERDVPIPVDEYGRSKVDSEKILSDYSHDFHSIIIRCPAIIDENRLGMFSIIFDFIREGKKCWILGDGEVPYQTIFASDLIDACMKATHKESSLVLNIGSDHVPTIRHMYQYIIDHAGTSARIAHIPKLFALSLMKIAYKLRISPLGPVQFRMLTCGFEFDNALIKRELDWTPTLNTCDMLLKAYEFYLENRSRLINNDVSANRQIITKIGILRLVKLLS